LGSGGAKGRRKKAEQTILARKDQSNRVCVNANSIFKVKMQQNNYSSQNEASPATAYYQTCADALRIPREFFY